jgi:hypothetical protein
VGSALIVLDVEVQPLAASLADAVVTGPIREMAATTTPVLRGDHVDELGGVVAAVPRELDEPGQRSGAPRERRRAQRRSTDPVTPIRHGFAIPAR